jgi:hypothetical protein
VKIRIASAALAGEFKCRRVQKFARSGGGF